MQNSSSFNLDVAIAVWRDELTRQPGLTPADLRELEAHLRDGFAELRKVGLRDDEAFLIARHRVGPTQPVAAEFAKTAPRRVWTNRIFWLSFALLLIQIWQSSLAWYARYLYLNTLDTGLHYKTGMFNYEQTINRIFDGIGLALPGVVIVVGPLVLALCWHRRGMKVMTRVFSARAQTALAGAGLFLVYFVLRLFLASQEMFALSPFNRTYWNGLFSTGISGSLFAAWPGEDFLGKHFGWDFMGTYEAGFVFLWPLFLVALMIWLTPGSAKTKTRAVVAT